MTPRQEANDLQQSYTKVPPKAAVRVEKVTERGDRVLDLDGVRVQIGRVAAEELLGVLSKSLRPYAGYSIFDRIMQELDAVLDRLMAGEPDEAGRDPGRAEAYTMALALIRNPYEPNYSGERDRQMERWEKRNAE